MTAAVQRPLPVAVTKIPLLGKIQSLVYSIVLGQWAVGFWSGAYVLITQAHYFGKSFKYTWDNLDLLWHLGAIPLIGHWLVAHYNIARHIFGRDEPETVLAYALVAMVVTVLITKKKAKIPLLDKIMVRLGMPSPYQGDLPPRRFLLGGRHPDTSALQFLFLLPSMLLASLPGTIIASVIIFLGLALATKLGYHSAWLTAQSWWVPVVIGIAGGRLAGHKPAVKAGQDVQRFFLDKRLHATYLAEGILSKFQQSLITRDEARDILTSMRQTEPSAWYPASYRVRYNGLLADREPTRPHGAISTVAIVSMVAVVVVLGGWGVYLRKWGIGHGFWLPW